jgi:hypothetical protein
MLHHSYRQEATYWGAPVPNGYGGHSYSDPVLLNVRWEGMPERFTDGTGEEHVAQAVVYVPVDVEVGGYLALGDRREATAPTDLNDALPVRQFMKVPDLRNVDVERRAFL